MSQTCEGCARWQALEGQDIWGQCLLPTVKHAPLVTKGFAAMHTLSSFSCSAWTAHIERPETMLLFAPDSTTSYGSGAPLREPLVGDPAIGG